uniref:C2H2-type domain-containing protein n=1 Tax=Callorhinchus milii TaxID=7868 RepID=A0A4W3J516_CALMI|eukprot:gi/632944432/ref/XP_007887505.1/ PREDICTED: zinc finger protein 821 [Callorhinchus milii]
MGILVMLPSEKLRKENCGDSTQYSEHESFPKEPEGNLSPSSTFMPADNNEGIDSHNMKGPETSSDFSQSEESQESEDQQENTTGYQCPLCELTCETTCELSTHIQQHHQDIRGTKGINCSICGGTLNSISSLDKHTLGPGRKPHHCAVCGQTLTTEGHIHSEKLSDGKPDPEHNCPGASVPEEPGPFWNSVVAASMLFVCETCITYRNLMEAQETSVQKWMVRRQNEPLHIRLQRLERERTAKRLKRANETPDERETRRLRDREAKRLQRLQESEEQRARRLQRDREAMRMKRANETPEKRQARLIREREAKRIKRRLQKLDPSLSLHISQNPSTPEINPFQLHVA